MHNIKSISIIHNIVYECVVSNSRIVSAGCQYVAEANFGFHLAMGQFKCSIAQIGGVNFSRKKHYGGVRCNVISVMRGWVGVQFSEVKLET